MDKFKYISSQQLSETFGGNSLTKLIGNTSGLFNPINRYPKIPEPVPRILY